MHITLLRLAARFEAISAKGWLVGAVKLPPATSSLCAILVADLRRT